MKGTMTVRGLLGVLTVLMLSLTFAAGCNLLASDQDQTLENQKQKNEELQKQLEEQQEQEELRKEKEEEARQKELEQQVEDLEKKVDSQDEKISQENASQPTESSQPEQSQPQQAEEQAQAAAESYYQAVEAENWGYTYDHLDSETQSAFTRDEWFAKNQGGASASPATFAVQYVDMDNSSPSTLANVTVLVTGEDGSASVRNTYFVYEDGSWKHRFSPEEYEIFANAPSGTATASPSASISASSSPSASADSGGVTPLSQTACPQNAPIKGNESSSGELIYHTSSSATYDETSPEECFATEAAAQAAGYRAAED